MYLVIIGWMYVALMMTVAEAASPGGSILGAMVTFFLYGLLPAALLAYILGTPGRRRARKDREAAEFARAKSPLPAAEPEGSAAAVVEPDAGREAPADAVAPVGEKPGGVGDRAPR